MSLRFDSMRRIYLEKGTIWRGNHGLGEQALSLSLSFENMLHLSPGERHEMMGQSWPWWTGTTRSMLDTWESRILSRKILEKAVRFTTVTDIYDDEGFKKTSRVRDREEMSLTRGTFSCCCVVAERWSYTVWYIEKRSYDRIENEYRIWWWWYLMRNTFVLVRGPRHEWQSPQTCNFFTLMLNPTMMMIIFQ